MIAAAARPTGAIAAASPGYAAGTAPHRLFHLFY
jgi:hypothetical protein